MLDPFLAPFGKTRIVDIGANPIDGDPPYKRMLEQGLCQVVGFEPNQEACALLNERKGPDETYLPYAIADGQKWDLFESHAPGLNSLFVMNDKSTKLFHDFVAMGKVLKKTSIETKQLDAVEEVKGMDFLRMDAQGAESTILSYGHRKLENTVVVQLEVSFVPLYHAQPTFGTLDTQLRQLGFIPHTFEGVKLWPIGGMENNLETRQLLEADIVYIRDIRYPENLSDDQLRHLAAIAYYCYGSTDLVSWCEKTLLSRL